MRKNFFNIVLAAIASLALVSCNNAQKMIDGANQIGWNCNPEVLEVVAGNINADVTVTFPADYFLPKAILEVTPVLVYEGGEVAGKPFVYQGEKITENYKTVSKKNGATIKESVHFGYVPGMEKSQLVARAKVIYGAGEYPFPFDIKIADGANTTYMLVEKDGAFPFAPSGYQAIIPETAEAQIMYLINSADVRNSELKSADVKAWQEALKALANDERREIKGTEIIAYASPDGGVTLNDKLSAKREKSASKAFNKVAKKLETGDVTTKASGQDWEGFQALVNASNIEDKELILRVLSMYSDPTVREREIKNMSAVYSTLAKNVLPQLRRARFVTNVEFTNYTVEELAELVESNIDVLDEPALLEAAANAKDNAAKLAIYKQAIKKFNSDKARVNSAVVYLQEGKDADAKSVIAAADKNCPYVKNLNGVIALRAGKIVEASECFEAAGDFAAAKQNLAVIDILQGNYKAAAQKLAGTKSCNETLAYILTNQLDKAAASIKGTCPKCSYKKAIIAARQGKVAEAKAAIEAASKNAELAARAEKDVEFIKVR